MRLPADFPQQIAPPKFRDGHRIHWLPITNEEIECGTIIGHAFAYAHHRRQWTWQYLVWLDAPHRGTLTDTAWEDDLELLP
ncbi:MAG: hypothetical protein ACFB8W_09140 [Elainellaceae cyanobacterium]